ncbi:MAG TPA: hypothetical protein VID50_08290 [Candidatus Eisenbacteria bacterium]|jgi:hypothetical protein
MTARVLLGLTVFALGMGFVEAACVVSLKQLYFADGYRAPFHAIPPAALRLEQVREIATLVMLAGVALLEAGGVRGFLARGLWTFGAWDLSYYVFLRFLTGFPARLTDLDIVFLVPGPWVLPVWVPVAASVAALLAALRLGSRGRR